MILVAGGTGFVGSAIVRELARGGSAVAVFTRNPGQQRHRFPALDIEYRGGDVRQQFPNSPIEDAKRGHTFEEVDARGTENLVQAAKAAGVQRYVYLSGAGAAPDAERHWFRAKWRAETAIRESAMAFTIFRPSWIYGPEGRSLNRFLGMSRFLPFVPLIGSPGRQRLQPVFVEDVGRAAAEAIIRQEASGQTYEIGGPEVLTMREIVKTAIDVAGRKRLLLAAPKPVMKAAAFALQFAPGRPLTPDAVEFITADALADPAELERVLGLKMRPLQEALAIYLGK